MVGPRKRWISWKSQFPSQLLRDLEKDYPWSILCLQEFTASNGEVVSDTSEDHKVFVTPSCKEQLRLAIVASAEVLAFCEH